MRRVFGALAGVCSLPWLLCATVMAQAAGEPERPASAQPFAGRAPAGSPASPERSRQVARVAFGIVAYARWPDERAEIRFCLLGRSPHAEALSEGATLPGGRRIASERLADDDARLAERCDVVYVAADAAVHWPAIYRRLAGGPILSLCEEPEPCRAGGMFCLDLRGAELRFEANLDSIARSGVRVHPQVLQLGRRRQGPT